MLVLTGVEFEARTLARHLQLPPLADATVRAFGRGQFRVAAVGVGGSALGARWPALIAGLDRPLVVSAGLCGALDPRLAAGSLVVPEAVIDASGSTVGVDRAEHRRALMAAPSASAAPLATAVTIVATPEEKARLMARSGASSVDMESALILKSAAGAGLVSLVVRGVSDDARQPLPPELAGLTSADGRIRPWRAAALLARPAALPGLLALMRGSRLALARVAAVLAALTR